MQELILILSGFIVGGALVRYLMIKAAQRGLRPHELDPQYWPAVRAVMRHLKAHGTINLSQVEQLLSIRGITAMRYLDQMAHDGLVKLHAHSQKEGGGNFYTIG